MSTAIHNVSLVIALMERANLGLQIPLFQRTWVNLMMASNGKGKIEYTDWGVSFEGFL